MKIVFIPNWQNNPYQKSLAEGISNCGNDVVFGVSYEKFSILRSVFNAWKPDALHIHWPDPYMFPFYRHKFKNIQIFFISMNFLLQVMVSRIMGIKIVWTIHNLIKHDSKYKNWELFIYRGLSKLSNRLIVHSQYAKNQVEKLYRVKKSDKIAVIPHANYINDYENSINMAEARKKLGYDDDHRIFLFFGAVRPYKGIEDLITAFKHLKDSRARLIVAGECFDKPFAEKLESLRDNNTNIKLCLERVANDDIQIYMNAADYVVLPFRNIFTSGSVMLALSFSKPVIVPSIGSIPELLADTDNILYNPNDEQSLYNALRSAIDTDGVSAGKKNYELVKNWSWDKIGQMTAEAYR